MPYNAYIRKLQSPVIGLMSQGSLNPKKLDTQSDYCGDPFRVSGFFPSTDHQHMSTCKCTFQLSVIRSC